MTGELDELIASAEYQFRRSPTREQAVNFLHWSLKGHPTQVEHCANKLLAHQFKLTDLMRTLRERGLIEGE